MKLGSPQIFVNLEVSISILIGNARRRIKTEGVRKKVKMVPISLRRSPDFFQLCGYA